MTGKREAGWFPEQPLPSPWGFRWSLKLPGIPSEQRSGVQAHISVLGEGAVGWLLVGDEHGEPLGMFWQR